MIINCIFQAFIHTPMVFWECFPHPFFFFGGDITSRNLPENVARGASLSLALPAKFRTQVGSLAPWFTTGKKYVQWSRLSRFIGDGVIPPTFNDGILIMGPYKPLRTWVDEFIPYYMEMREKRPWHIWMFPKIGAPFPPKNGWWKFHGSNPMNKWMIWGFSQYFWKHPFVRNVVVLGFLNHQQ